MTVDQSLTQLLRYPAPTGRIARSVLVTMRRIAIGGIDDAHATNQLIGTLGLGYRRPLIFLRVLMTEIERISTRPIAVAPCCCPHMTEGEAALLLAIDTGSAHPDVARAAIARITGSLDGAPALSIAQALADALDDIGRPLTF